MLPTHQHQPDCEHNLTNRGSCALRQKKKVAVRYEIERVLSESRCGHADEVIISGFGRYFSVEIVRRNSTYILEKLSFDHDPP